MQCLLLLVLVAIYLVPHGSFMIFPTLGRSAHRVVVRMNKEGDGESKRFINPSFFERAKRGVVFSHELDKLFMPKKYDLDRILQPFSKGHAGFILSLENILLDLDALYHYAFMMLADELGYEVPSQTLVNDVIGLPFRDAVTSFAWDVPHNLLPTCEQFFFKVLENAFTSTPDKPPKIAINVRAGAVDLLDSMIRDGNEVAITSNLPRPLVTKLLTLTNLVMLFEGRVDPERLVTSLEDEMKPSLPPLELDELNGAAMGKERFEAEEDPFYEMDQLIDNFYTPTHGDRYQVQKYLKCCALMQKPPVLCLALESNRKNVISAKRAGINCVALKGKDHHIEAENPLFNLILLLSLLHR